MDEVKLVEEHDTLVPPKMMLSKLKLLTWRMRQLFKIGKTKQQQYATHMHNPSSSSSNNINNNNNNNNNCETENNNNVNSELSKLCLLFTSEMAENAANEWLLQQQVAAIPSPAIAYAEDMEPNVICIQTEAGHFYWNATEQFNEIVWK
ncbi:unnamed protein product [Ceratitis capitata]|uniref:(Mediterranean fruit fly) hypothetical protein n=1 Tax=Ceratitis capitata TaxID=7213 RepID=A0A811TZ55_CERCA|nr:unnamed protein product [Ceratitis capitata]